MFMKVYHKMEMKKVIEYLLVAEVIYLLIGLVMYINPSVHQFITSILQLGEGAELAYEVTSFKRIHGFGASFFSAGVVNGFMLICLMYYMLKYKHETLRIVLLWFFFAAILIMGMMMSRSTLMGLAGCIPILFFYISKSLMSFVRYVIVTIVALYLIFYLLGKISSTFAEYEELAGFAFEMIDRYEDTGSLSTSSSNKTFDMFSILPTDIKTWVIGDAKWTNSNGTFYMYTDVGYSRYLWYFGLIGMFGMLIYNLIYLRRAFSNKIFEKREKKILVTSFFIFTLVCNIKGVTDLYFYLLPFLFCKYNVNSQFLRKNIRVSS